MYQFIDSDYEPREALDIARKSLRALSLLIERQDEALDDEQRMGLSSMMKAVAGVMSDAGARYEASKEAYERGVQDGMKMPNTESYKKGFSDGAKKMLDDMTELRRDARAAEKKRPLPAIIRMDDLESATADPAPVVAHSQVSTARARGRAAN